MQILGYQLPVAFNESIWRTVAWLAFAGYPIKAESVEMS